MRPARPTPNRRPWRRHGMRDSPHSDQKTYPCDRKYTFGPDESTVTHNGDIGKWFETEIIGKNNLSTIQTTFKEYEKTIDSDINQQLMPDKACIDYSPFIKLWNHLVKKENKKLKEKYFPNERIDTSHGAFSLSYCDYFIANDEPLRARSRKIKEELNLEVSITNSNEFLTLLLL